MKKIFDPIEGKEEARKIMIVGSAGIGKTTLLHHIAYEWGKGRAFNDMFDYVFKVRLKKLADWSEKNPVGALEKFIFESWSQNYLEVYNTEGISEQIEAINIEEGEILSFLKKDGEKSKARKKRTLLLLDGYDEIASLTRQKGHIAYTIFREIFEEYPNIIMTSRPNALNSEIAGKFTRKIESTGLDQQGVSAYLDNYFSKQSQMLVQDVSGFFATYKEKPGEDIKEKILEYSKRSKNRTMLEKLSTIYEGKKFGQTKEEFASSIKEYYEGHKTKLLEQDNMRKILETPINAAMVCLISTDPDFGEKFRKEFNLSDLYEGVLIWLGRRYKFKFFYEEIEENIKIDMRRERILNFPVVKLLGKIAYDALQAGEYSIDEKDIEDSTKSFGKKLTLLKVVQYGLLRGNQKKEGDARGEKYEFIHLSFQEHMTAQMLKEALEGNHRLIMTSKETANFIAEHRKEPRYLMTLKFLAGLMNESSEPGRKRFWEALMCNIDGVLELGIDDKIKLLMNVLGQSKVEGKLNEQIPNFKKVTELIDKELLKDIVQWEEAILESGYLSEGLINKVKELVSNAEGSEELDTAIRLLTAFNSKFGGSAEVFSKLIEFADNSQLRWQTRVVSLQNLGVLVNNSGPIEGDVSILDLRKCLDLITELFKDPNLEQDMKDLVTKILIKLSQSSGSLCEELKEKTFSLIVPEGGKREARRKARDCLTKLVKNATQATGTFALVIPLLKDDDRDVRSSALDCLTEIAKKDASKAGEIFSLVTPFLKDEDWCVRSSAIYCLKEVAKIDAGKASEIFSLVSPLLKDKNGNIRIRALYCLTEVTKTDASKSAEILSLVTPFLKNDDRYVRRSALECLTEIAKIDATQTAEIFSLAVPLLQDYDRYVRRSAIYCLTEVTQTDASKAAEIFRLAAPLLKDEDSDVRRSAIYCLTEVTQTDASKAAEIFNLAVPLLQDEDWCVRSSALECLTEVVKIDTTKVDEIFTLAVPLLKDDNEYVRSSALDCLTDVAKIDVSLFATLLKDEDSDVRRSALDCLTEAAKIDETRAAAIVSLVAPLLKDAHWNGRRRALECLIEVVKIDASKAGEIFSLAAPLLKDDNSDVRKIGLKCLGEVAKKDASKAAEIFSLVAPFLKDEGWYVKGFAIRCLADVVKIDASKAPEIFNLVVPLLKDKHDGIRSSVLDCLKEVTKIDASKAAEIFSLVPPFLKDKDSFVRSDATKTLISIGENISFKEVVNLFFKQKNKDLTKEVIDTITKDLCKRLKDSVPTNAIVKEDEEDEENEERANQATESVKDNFTYQDAPALMYILGITSAATDKVNKELNELAKVKLEKLAEDFDSESIKWLSENFEEIPATKKIKTFFTKLFPKFFENEGENNRLTPEGKKIISYCIEKELTIHVTRDGTIFFEGVKYDLPKTEDQFQYINEIIEESLKEEGDMLTDQYKNFDPIFENTGSGIEKAASDIKEVLSFADGKTALSSDTGILTSLQLLFAANEEDNPFFLFEKRSPFGYRIAYKLNANGERIGEKEEIYPEISDLSMRATLFGKGSASLYEAKSVVTNSTPTSEDFEKLRRSTDCRKIEKAELLGLSEGKIMQYRHERTLNVAGVYDMADVAIGFKNIEEREKELFVYLETFYWTILNFFEVYRVISTGIIQTTEGKNVLDDIEEKVEKIEKVKEQIPTIVEKVNEYLPSIVNAAKNFFEGIGNTITENIGFVGHAVDFVASSAPIVGGAIGTIKKIADEINKNIKDRKAENTTNAIVKIIMTKMKRQEEISLSLAKLALKITTTNKEKIKSKIKPEVVGTIKSKEEKSWLTKQIENLKNLKEKVYPAKIELNDVTNPLVQMALEDVAITIAYLSANSEEIIKDARPLDSQLADAINQKKLENFWSEREKELKELVERKEERVERKEEQAQRKEEGEIRKEKVEGNEERINQASRNENEVSVQSSCVCNIL